jgi:hypothetical protein
VTPEAEVLHAVVLELEKDEVPYMVVGSFASGLWGRPRATHDADLVVALDPESAMQLSGRLADRFYADAEFMVSAVHKRSMFNVIHHEWGFKVDVWMLQADDYAQVAFVRRRREPFFGADGFDAFVAAPEDTIISKLRWYQQTTWERDFLDALGVYELQEPELDQAYLDGWAMELKLAELIARLRREAARSPTQ